MNTNQVTHVAKWSFLLGLVALMASCVVAEPREGYWDHDHNRYYHNHGWHDCTPRDDFCH